MGRSKVKYESKFQKRIDVGDKVRESETRRTVISTFSTFPFSTFPLFHN